MIPHLVGAMTDIDGEPIGFSVNRDGTIRVQIGGDGAGKSHVADLDREKAEEFARLLVACCWKARA